MMNQMAEWEMWMRWKRYERLWRMAEMRKKSRIQKIFASLRSIERKCGNVSAKGKVFSASIILQFQIQTRYRSEYSTE